MPTLPTVSAAPAPKAAASPAEIAQQFAAHERAMYADNKANAKQRRKRPLGGFLALLLVLGAVGFRLYVRYERAQYRADRRAAPTVVAELPSPAERPNPLDLPENQVPPASIQQPAPPVTATGPLPPGFDVGALTSASQQWLAWAAAQPIETNPIHDTSGEHCAAGQAADGVWNLAGSFGTTVTRQCTVPSGRPLLVPAINQWCEPTVDCSFAVEGEHSVTVDGVEAFIMRVVTSDVTVDPAPSNGMFAAAGPQSASMDGYWAMIDPLPVGEHIVRVTATRGEFSLDVTYNLTVV